MRRHTMDNTDAEDAEANEMPAASSTGTGDMFVETMNNSSDDPKKFGFVREDECSFRIEYEGRGFSDASVILVGLLISG